MAANEFPPTRTPANMNNEQTFVMKRAELNAPQPVHLGPVDLNAQAPIIFEIDGQQIILPVAETIRVGRKSANGETQPDVDLTRYGAATVGVSRSHIRLRRRNGLVYVMDLGSANGTTLNGRALMPNAELLLRDGDELRLASMIISVKYQPR